MFSRDEHLKFKILYFFGTLIFIFVIGRSVYFPYFYIQPKVGETWIYQYNKFSKADTLKILNIEPYIEVLYLENSKDTINHSMTWFLISTKKL
jgi:hypothetical protein